MSSIMSTNRATQHSQKIETTVALTVRREHKAVATAAAHEVTGHTASLVTTMLKFVRETLDDGAIRVFHLRAQAS